MQVIIFDEAQQVAAHAAQWVSELLQKNSKPVLGLATGSTPIALYKNLVGMHNDQQLSFKNATSFNLDEYHNIDPNNAQSYRSFMNTHLFDSVDIDLANTHLPTCSGDENPRDQGLKYEQAIKDAGGIDLQILGLGANGHIGFNEPTSSLVSKTRIKTLTEQTIKDNSRLFSKDEHQPDMAMTMGIGTIMNSRYVLLMATGENKAAAVNDMITGPLSAMCPASALQMHENAIIILDKAAASQLADKSYYQWADKQNSLVNKRYGLYHNY
ncbi:MAG: glucosamine-6-phosphate deaminase [Phenylobacterium sp.]|jgi:glucosamine-6-phosphate deaminase